MNSTRLQRYALIAEIIGGAAIVISLIFVGVEVRQSAKAQRAASYQSLIQSISDINALMIDSPGFAELLVDSENYETMSESERAKIFSYLLSVYRHGDLAYYQFKQGVIGEEQLNSVLKIVTFNIRQRPAGRLIWDTRKELKIFAKDYTDYVDAMLEEGN